MKEKYIRIKNAEDVRISHTNDGRVNVSYKPKKEYSAKAFLAGLGITVGLPFIVGMSALYGDFNRRVEAQNKGLEAKTETVVVQTVEKPAEPVKQYSINPSIDPEMYKAAEKACGNYHVKDVKSGWSLW